MKKNKKKELWEDRLLGQDEKTLRPGKGEETDWSNTGGKAGRKLWAERQEGRLRTVGSP